MTRPRLHLSEARRASAVAERSSPANPRARRTQVGTVAFAAIPNPIVSAVSDRETGETTGVNTIMRNIGSAVGAQIAGSIIAAHVLASGRPQNGGFEIAFLISAAGAIVAALSVLLISGRGRRFAAEVHCRCGAQRLTEDRSADRHEADL